MLDTVWTVWWWSREGSNHLAGRVCASLLQSALLQTLHRDFCPESFLNGQSDVYVCMSFALSLELEGAESAVP